MLVLQHGGQLLMEKRPSTGIWGGLWSFPEIEAAEIAMQVCRSQYGAQVRVIDQLAPIEHGFTHFCLTIAPLLCRVEQRALQAQMPGKAWVGLDEAMQYPIPAPVRRLVSELRARLGTPAISNQAG